MFRLMFIKKGSTSDKDSIPVFDKIQEDFNVFRVDADNRRIEVHPTPAFSRGYKSTEVMFEALTAWRRLSNLKWERPNEFESTVYVYIPEGYDVFVILK